MASTKAQEVNSFPLKKGIKAQDYPRMPCLELANDIMRMYCTSQEESPAMRYSELVESKTTESKIREFLTDGEMIAITFRIPKNLKDSAVEAASLKGMSFSAFIRMSMMEQLAKHPNE